MGLWVELGFFLLPFIFAIWQFRDLKKAKAERLVRKQPPETPAAQQPPKED